MESMNEEKKTLIHISHLHPLKMIDCQETKPICHACHQSCNENTYGCDECSYFLHTKCASFKRNLDHCSHPAHTLNLLLTPRYTSGEFSCDACGGDGHTFCFHCKECQFDLHLSCASLPEKLIHPSHPHFLELVHDYVSPSSENEYESASCDLCEESLDLFKWFYNCNKCNYLGHTDCFTNSQKAEERLTRRNEQITQQQAQNVSSQTIELFQMQQKMNIHMMNLKMMNDISRGIINLTKF